MTEKSSSGDFKSKWANNMDVRVLVLVILRGDAVSCTSDSLKMRSTSRTSERGFEMLEREGEREIKCLPASLPTQYPDPSSPSKYPHPPASQRHRYR